MEEKHQNLIFNLFWFKDGNPKLVLNFRVASVQLTEKNKPNFLGAGAGEFAYFFFEKSLLTYAIHVGCIHDLYNYTGIDKSNSYDKYTHMHLQLGNFLSRISISVKHTLFHSDSSNDSFDELRRHCIYPSNGSCTEHTDYGLVTFQFLNMNLLLGIFCEIFAGAGG